MTEPRDFCRWACCASLYPASSLVILSDLKRFLKPLTLGKFKSGMFFYFKEVGVGRLFLACVTMIRQVGCRIEMLPRWSCEAGNVLIILHLSPFIVMKCRQVSVGANASKQSFPTMPEMCFQSASGQECVSVCAYVCVCCVFYQNNPARDTGPRVDLRTTGHICFHSVRHCFPSLHL